MTKFSKGEAIKYGWENTKKNFWFLASMVLIAVGISMLTSSLKVIGVIVGIVIQMGIIHVMLKFVDKEKPKYDDLFYYKSIINFFFSSIVFGVAVMIGFVLLIVPGIIIAIRYQFYSYYVVDKNLKPIEAIQKSWETTKGNGWNLFVFGLMLIGINILGALALGVGLFFTIPTTMLATVYVYRQLVTK